MPLHVLLFHVRSKNARVATYGDVGLCNNSIFTRIAAAARCLFSATVLAAVPTGSSDWSCLICEEVKTEGIGAYVRRSRATFVPIVREANIMPAPKQADLEQTKPRQTSQERLSESDDERKKAAKGV